MCTENSVPPPFKRGDVVSNGIRRTTVNAVFVHPNGRWYMLEHRFQWHGSENIAGHCKERPCKGWYKIL